MYYTIKTSTGKDVGKVFPQVRCLNQQLAHSIQLSNFINIDSELLYVLEPKAKLTNILSQCEISALGFLIDKKTKNILQNFDLVNHNYNKAIVKQGREATYDYAWLHLGSELKSLEWLDYENSTFYVKEYGFRKENISIGSYADFLQKTIGVGDMAVICIEDVRIKKNLAINLDLFSIPLLSRRIFISQKLKLALEENSITGIVVEEAFK